MRKPVSVVMLLVFVLQIPLNAGIGSKDTMYVGGWYYALIY